MAREMKNSGIEWIGEIPSDWEIRKLKTCILQRDSGAWGNEANGNERDTICLRIADFNYAMFRFKDTEERLLTKRNYNEEIIKNLILQKNDIVIEKSGGGEKTPVGRTVIFDKDYKAVYANFCDRLRCRKRVLPWFMQYIFVAFYLNGYVWNYIKQTTGIQNLDLTAMLSSEKVALPTLVEQKKIIDFLNVSCEEIDNVREKTRASIEEYKKLKQAIITQVVIKGVRGDREMKDSGVGWIGEIPKEWNCAQLGKFITIQSGISVGKSYPEDAELVEIPYLRVANVQGDYVDTSDVATLFVTPYEAEKYRLHAGHLLMTEGGDRDKLGRGCLWNGEIDPCIHQNHIFAVETNKLLDIRYLDYITTSNVARVYFDITAKKTTNLACTNKSTILKFIIPLPAKDEQIEIIDYLNVQCPKIDSIIEKKEKYLIELDNYKKSLIYEYVTGKKEVSQEYKA